MKKPKVGDICVGRDFITLLEHNGMPCRIISAQGNLFEAIWANGRVFKVHNLNLITREIDVWAKDKVRALLPARI